MTHVETSVTDKCDCISPRELEKSLSTPTRYFFKCFMWGGPLCTYKKILTWLEKRKQKR